MGALVGLLVDGASVGALVGLLVDLPFFFATFLFFPALAVVVLADTVGLELTVGWFVGLLVLELFFFCMRRSVMPEDAADASCASAVQAKTDSHKASSAVDAS